MQLDEQVYIAKSSDLKHVAAIGMRMANWHEFLVGVYFYWNQIADREYLLGAVLKRFGEASLYGKQREWGHGLICKLDVITCFLILTWQKLQQDLI